MKKKILIFTAVFAVLFIGFGAYSILADSPGYDAYKAALKKTHTMDSATTKVEMVITDNGELLQEMTFSAAHSLEQRLAQGEVEVRTPQQQLQLIGSFQGDKLIVKGQQDDTYYVNEVEHKEIDQEKMENFHNPEMMKLGEMVVDMMMQPVQGDFHMSGNEIKIDATNEDIPSMLHSIGAQMVKMGFKHHSNIEVMPEDYPFLAESFQFEMPALKDEISIEKVLVEATLTDDGYLEKQDAIFVIHGKDSDGNFHELEIEMNLSISNINSTTVETVSLDGKNIEELQLENPHNF